MNPCIIEGVEAEVRSCEKRNDDNVSFVTGMFCLSQPSSGASQVCQRRGGKGPKEGSKEGGKEKLLREADT